MLGSFIDNLGNLRNFVVVDMAMRATRKCATGQIWPAGQGLRTAELHTAHLKIKTSSKLIIFYNVSMNCKKKVSVNYFPNVSSKQQPWKCGKAKVRFGPFYIPNRVGDIGVVINGYLRLRSCRDMVQPGCWSMYPSGRVGRQTRLQKKRFNLFHHDNKKTLTHAVKNLRSNIQECIPKTKSWKQIVQQNLYFKCKKDVIYVHTRKIGSCHCKKKDYSLTIL